MKTKTYPITMLGIAVSLCLLHATVSAASPADKVWTAGLEGQQRFDSFVVKYNDGTLKQRSPVAAARAISTTSMTPQDASGRRIAGARPLATLSHERRTGSGADVVKADRALTSDAARQVMLQIAQDPDVQYVEPNIVMRAFTTPNDPLLRSQWHYGEGPGGIRVPKAWEKASGIGVVVAVVDTGILPDADLDASILPGYNMVSHEGNGRNANPADSPDNGHGTHVAGTIAAVTNNARGVAGVAFDARVVPVRVLGADGSGSFADVIDGILWGAGLDVPGAPRNPNPAEVINLSLGGRSPCSPLQQDAIDRAVEAGAVVVVAAGNSNQDVAGFTPASCRNVISVAANDRDGDRALYSNYGSKIDVTAPGGETWSCPDVGRFLPLGVLPTPAACGRRVSHPQLGVLSVRGNNTVEFFAGTSMAAPHVAGIAALVQSVSPLPRTPAEIESIIKRTARPIAPSQCPGGCGTGLVDAEAAVSAAMR